MCLLVSNDGSQCIPHSLQCFNVFSPRSKKVCFSFFEGVDGEHGVTFIGLVNGFKELNLVFIGDSSSKSQKVSVQIEGRCRFGDE